MASRAGDPSSAAPSRQPCAEPHPRAPPPRRTRHIPPPAPEPAPRSPLPRSTPPRHFTTKSALLAQPGIETSRFSFLLRVPALRTRTLENQRRSKTFCSCRGRAAAKGPRAPREGSRTTRAAPRRAATDPRGWSGAAAPAHPSRRTLVFRVDLPHQRDVPLQVERQGLDGVQVVLHIVHQVDLLPVGRAQHGSPRSPAARRGFPLPPAPAPSEPSPAKCKPPARRRRRPPLLPAPRRYICEPRRLGPGTLRGGPGQRSAASGAGRACGRAPRRRGRGRAERAREGERAARRAALVQRGKPKYQFQTLGKHSAPRTAHALRHPPLGPLPTGPAPAAFTPLTGPAARGCGFVCHLCRGGGGRGGKRPPRRRKLYYEFRTWEAEPHARHHCVPAG